MKKLVVLIVVVGIGVAGYIYGKPYYDLHYSTIHVASGSTIFFIPTGSSMEDISRQLDSLKILSPEKFTSFSEELEFDESKIEPGKYLIEDGMTIKSLIYGFKNGNQEIKDVRLTFNNCETVEDMAGQVSKFIEADSAEIATFANRPETMSKYGFREATFIAMFLPDTYEIGEWDVTAEEFIQFMADRYKEFWNDETADRSSKANKLGLQQSEVSTLATIVMAEQGRFEQEWKTISGLYLNRLDRGIRLQSDPTAKFCWGDELDTVQRILYAHLEKDCPYNTYIYAGLPPGPLKMPTKTAIDAVLNAEDHDYIYMCARADNSGLHKFAESLEEHNKNAAAFRKWMNERGL